MKSYTGKVLVTGGSGMVGRSLHDLKPNWIYVSSSQYDLTKEESVRKMFDDIGPEMVIHLAAKVGGIIDNIKHPVDYYDQNILMNTLILKYSHLTNVKRFIGMLSTCIYPDVVDEYPMRESILHQGPPTKTNFSYGYSKRGFAVQIDAYNEQYKKNYQYLIPCNLYGPYDKYGENSHFIAALIKKIHNAGTDKKVTLFGTGKPLRQFMHSNDLANIIVKCIEENVYENMNVATDENLTIKEMAEIARVAMNKDVFFEFDSSKPDGQYRKDVSTNKIKNSFPTWNPIKLEQGIRDTYAYLLKHELL